MNGQRPAERSAALLHRHNFQIVAAIAHEQYQLRSSGEPGRLGDVSVGREIQTVHQFTHRTSV